MTLSLHISHPKWLQLAALLAFLSPTLRAQEVFILVRQSNERAIQQAGNGYVQREVARFQLEALDFLESEALKNLQKQSVNDFLDTQAYFLSRFIGSFCDDVLTRRRITPEKAEERMLHFRHSADKHPLFSSQDAQHAEEFLNDSQSFTPFSLNTDWKAAFESLRK